MREELKRGEQRTFVVEAAYLNHDLVERFDGKLE